MDDLLADFLTETNESLAELDAALVTLERTPDDAETLSFIFRLLHTIKGTCGFLGLPRLERVAHAGENVLGKLRDRTLAVTPDIITQVLAGIDQIKAIVAHLSETGAEPAGDDTALIDALNRIASQDALADGHSAISGEAVAATAAAEPAMPDASSEAILVETAAGAVTPSEIAQATPASGATAAPAQGQGAGAPANTQTIRVTVDVLENLMTLVSELVLTRNQLLQLARTQENSGFTAPLQRLSHITSDLQEGVMKTRMQPIGNAWNKLPRLVRDLSHEMGKKIQLTMLGADTEL
ncbi:MAG TPA: Hpt domain-containing protein, partial [Rhodopila sp.]|nr:Hpt domain-containing protein [Rhodopila sp.]